MLLNLYYIITIIIIIILIRTDMAAVINITTSNTINPVNNVNPAPQIKQEILRLLRQVNEKQNNNNPERLFGNIYEKITTESLFTNEAEVNLNEMRSSLLKLLNKVNKIENLNRIDKDVSSKFSPFFFLLNNVDWFS